MIIIDLSQIIYHLALSDAHSFTTSAGCGDFCVVHERHSSCSHQQRAIPQAPEHLRFDSWPRHYVMANV
ncbi:hypothetical protein NBRC111894_4142 [Sporolactobacillus inulinus]|uniref:Uncharacterized protein n=1 Tax=Sporolactobacillus inulinus TaxID=2078 RepID=A0A4Y1ZJJ3_9BACL|nr:hypothetical protein NBRC111894_4142 [Sporolactobacillus inulinus]